MLYLSVYHLVYGFRLHLVYGFRLQVIIIIIIRLATIIAITVISTTIRIKEDKDRNIYTFYLNLVLQALILIKSALHHINWPLNKQRIIGAKIN